LALINPKTKEVQVKLVYYGPGRGGKTTNLEYIYKKFQDRMTTKLTTVKTYGDRTLFFDFLPLDIGIIGGFNIKIQMYTVPGQVKYQATRRLILRGVDGIVFVADSMALREKTNALSLKDLQENLATFDKSIFKIPLVLQYNKQDLAKEGIPILPPEKLESTLNRQLKAPSFSASALKGENVVETMKKVISLTVSSLQEKLTPKQG
jgi:signal recognition particle receptor subunit beta